MTLTEDTRQQIHAGDKHSNIRNHCKQAGIEIVRTALPFGDYVLTENLVTTKTEYTDATGVLRTSTKNSIKAGSIVVDTKQNVLEIAGNIMHSNDHKRFKAECVKAQEAGCQLVILIEEVPPCGMLDLWQSPVFTRSSRYHRAGQPVTRMNPTNLRKCMETMHERYGVRFEFCDRKHTGRVLMSILTGDYRFS